MKQNGGFFLFFFFFFVEFQNHTRLVKRQRTQFILSPLYGVKSMHNIQMYAVSFQISMLTQEYWHWKQK